MLYHKNKKGFTLSEVLITLGIIGVVVAITIPSIINSTKDNEFKVAYKKAYSDLSRVLLPAYVDGDLSIRQTQYDEQQTRAEFDYIKAAFKVAKSCDADNFTDCWVKTDVGGDACGSLQSDGSLCNPSDELPRNGSSIGFVDGSGRFWATYYFMENIYMVDTNGAKGPNRLGKDRWGFFLANKEGVRVPDDPEDIVPAKVSPIAMLDIKSESWCCRFPPCYYYSWLYK